MEQRTEDKVKEEQVQVGADCGPPCSQASGSGFGIGVTTPASLATHSSDRIYSSPSAVSQSYGQCTCPWPNVYMGDGIGPNGCTPVHSGGGPNRCANNTCGSNGHSSRAPGNSYTCSCLPGYTAVSQSYGQCTCPWPNRYMGDGIGPNGCTPVHSGGGPNPCANNTCGSNGHSSRAPGNSYTCSCLPGYTAVSQSYGQCTCPWPKGYMGDGIGPNGCTPVHSGGGPNRCANNTCGSNGHSSRAPGNSYTCSCLPGYTAVSQSYGQCTCPWPNRYMGDGICPNGYTLVHSGGGPNPCANNTCGSNGHSSRAPGNSYTCSCLPGYTAVSQSYGQCTCPWPNVYMGDGIGPNGCTPVHSGGGPNRCANNTCGSNGHSSRAPGNSYTCSCLPGYTAVSQSYGQCTCPCPIGYMGDGIGPNGCTPVHSGGGPNRCANNTCGSNGHSSRAPGNSYTCSCLPGYTDFQIQKTDVILKGWPLKEKDDVDESDERQYIGEEKVVEEERRTDAQLKEIFAQDKRDRQYERQPIIISDEEAMKRHTSVITESDSPIPPSNTDDDTSRLSTSTFEDSTMEYEISQKQVSSPEQLPEEAVPINVTLKEDQRRDSELFQGVSEGLVRLDDSYKVIPTGEDTSNITKKGETVNNTFTILVNTDGSQEMDKASSSRMSNTDNDDVNRIEQLLEHFGKGASDTDEDDDEHGECDMVDSAIKEDSPDGQKVIDEVKKLTCLRYLKSVFQGRSSSERHKIFMRGSWSDRETLKYSSGVGPLDDNQVHVVYKILSGYLLKIAPKGAIDNPSSYVFDVLLPEAIIFALEKIHGIRKQEAEKVFREMTLCKWGLKKCSKDSNAV